MGKSKVESKNPMTVGAKVFIRTIAMYYTGLIVEMTDKVVVLDEAAWIADTGRFSNALKSGVVSEVEPYHTAVCVNRDHILDATLWSHDLPREVKP